MDIKDLWIGDRLLMPSGRTGTFEGAHKSGRARIKVDNKIFLISTDHLKPADPEEVESGFDDLVEASDHPSTPAALHSDTIDLQAEALGTDLAQALPQRILARQIEACRDFLHASIAAALPSLTIIHGKGSGLLQAEVHHLLADLPQVLGHESIHDGGATKVWLKPSSPYTS